jgi:ADP-heptose:LPS heptosyltransferase
MGERFRTRVMVVPRALASRLRPRGAKSDPRRILIAHNLLLGDTLMLTPLVAKLRERHPAAEITLLASPAAAPLYERRPYGVRALPFRPADASTTQALLREAPFDLAFVVGDNRYSWLAAAMGAGHLVAHAGDPRASSNWLVDEARPYPGEPGAWSDLVADLAEGPPPTPYRRGDWEAPSAGPFDLPQAPYVVLHVGGSTPLKHWAPERWRALAEALSAQGHSIAWSAGRGEEALVAAADPDGRHVSYAGRLDLSQLWHLVAGARLLVAPDTGVAHLGRVAWTPTVTLFGPGSAILAGPGRFWRDTPWRAVGRDPFPCRDQQFLFRRQVNWVRRCGRTLEECPEPRCMHAIEVAEVLAAASELVNRRQNHSLNQGTP